jgi:hypothetical protein
MPPPPATGTLLIDDFTIQNDAAYNAANPNGFTRQTIPLSFTEDPFGLSAGSSVTFFPTTFTYPGLVVSTGYGIKHEFKIIYNLNTDYPVSRYRGLNLNVHFAQVGFEVTLFYHPTQTSPAIHSTFPIPKFSDDLPTVKSIPYIFANNPGTIHFISVHFFSGSFIGSGYRIASLILIE